MLRYVKITLNSKFSVRIVATELKLVVSAALSSYGLITTGKTSSHIAAIILQFTSAKRR
jgi:hypothetical protein